MIYWLSKFFHIIILCVRCFRYCCLAWPVDCVRIVVVLFTLSRTCTWDVSTTVALALKLWLLTVSLFSKNWRWQCSVLFFIQISNCIVHVCICLCLIQNVYDTRSKCRRRIILPVSVAVYGWKLPNQAIHQTQSHFSHWLATASMLITNETQSIQTSVCTKPNKWWRLALVILRKITHKRVISCLLYDLRSMCR